MNRSPIALVLASLIASAVRLTHTTITANTNGVVISLGGAANSFGTNRIEGNDTDLIGTLTLIALE